VQLEHLAVKPLEQAPAVERIACRYNRARKFLNLHEGQRLHATMILAAPIEHQADFWRKDRDSGLLYIRSVTVVRSRNGQMESRPKVFG
jgi:hypothetical protein